jgi:hypothetical protein
MCFRRSGPAQAGYGQPGRLRTGFFVPCNNVRTASAASADANVASELPAWYNSGNGGKKRWLISTPTMVLHIHWTSSQDRVLSWESPWIPTLSTSTLQLCIVNGESLFRIAFRIGLSVPAAAVVSVAALLCVVHPISGVAMPTSIFFTSPLGDWFLVVGGGSGGCSCSCGVGVGNVGCSSVPAAGDALPPSSPRDSASATAAGDRGCGGRG